MRSQGSTASSLAIAGDHLFRLAPNDRLEGAAMAEVMRDDGIDVIVPIWRNDTGNTGLRDGAMQFFHAAGGIVHGGLPYDPATTDFTTTVNALGDAVHAAKNANPGKRVGVYIAAFEEGASIFDRARFDTDLSSARWYGGDGLTQSQALLANPAVASFAAATSFTASVSDRRPRASPRGRCAAGSAGRAASREPPDLSRRRADSGPCRARRSNPAVRTPAS